MRTKPTTNDNNENQILMRSKNTPDKKEIETRIYEEQYHENLHFGIAPDPDRNQMHNSGVSYKAIYNNQIISHESNIAFIPCKLITK